MQAKAIPGQEKKKSLKVFARKKKNMKALQRLNQNDNDAGKSQCNKQGSAAAVD